MIRTDLIRPLHELLRDHAGSRGGETAFSDACRAVTWAELERRTAWLAGHLASQGLERGERAALFLDNSVSMVEGYLALARVGAVGVPVGPHTTGAELTHMVGDAAIRLIVTDGPRLPVVTRMLAEYPDLLVVVTGDAVPEGALSFDDFATADPGVAPRDDLGLDDPAFLLYTSGTTGRPKGVLSTTRNSLWNIAACYTPVLGLSHGDEVLWPLPLSHCLGHHLGVLGVVATGASAYILNGFAPGEVLDLLARRPFTFLAAVPSMYQQLVYAAEGRAPVRNSLRMCFVAGSATTEALRTQVADVFGVPLTVGYGTTETCGLITSDWPDTARVPGSCGLPVTGLSVRLVDPQSSADVGQGAEGEVWVRGPGVMLGYWDGAAGAAVPPAEGWYRTGDLARADEAGYLTITGRIKELILRGGENIHPSEVEEVIARVPGVRDVAVFGAPHAVLGQMPVALVIPGPGGLDPAAVFAACRADLSYYKVPVQLHAVAEVPRTASGKIVRAALSDLPRRLLATATGRVEGVLRDSRPAAVTVDPRFDTAGTVLVTGPLAETVAHHLRLGHGFERVALYETPSPVAVIHTAEPATPVSYDGDPFVLTLVPIEEEGLANGANVTVAYDTEADLRTALDVALGAPDGRLVATTPAEAAALLDTDPSTEWSDTDDSPKAALAAELSALAPAERVDRMSAVVAAAAEKILAAPLSDLPFIDLGLTSSMAVALRNRLVTATGLRLPTALVFDYPTPSALATHLVELLCGPAKASARTSRRELPSTDPVVIVGMACRFPGGVEGPNDLWQLVSDSADAIGPFPLDRGWPGEFEGSFPRVGGFLYGAAEFDAEFFGISPNEALAMDPQQRLLLEVSWEALEDAGIDPVGLRGSSTGVFAGASGTEYLEGSRRVGDVRNFFLTGSAGSVLSGRVAYSFGFEGPAVTVDTACSSSLVSLHLAAQALRSGECSLALAGGVAVMASPSAFEEFDRQGGLASDGRCKSFAQAADGTGWAEGVGLVVLQRLSDARREGRRVLAVLRGSAVNQDGASNGLTAPNGPSQQRVIQRALASGGLSAGQVDVVEAHGTGTRLGDPIEAQAIVAAYGRDRPVDRPLWLGSVKSNIGHAQAAAGVAGVIKMVMAIRHGVVPATLHVDEPSAHVDWDAGAVRLVTEPVEWPETGGLRRAGVSAFGISGTNAHVIVEQADPRDEQAGLVVREQADPGDEQAGLVVREQADPGDEQAGLVVREQADPGDEQAGLVVREQAAVGGAGLVSWVVSGKSRQALVGQARRLLDWARRCPDLPVGDVAGALVSSRAVFEHRAVVTGADREQLLAGLAGLAAGEPGPGVVSGVARAGGGRVAFVFPGQGSQWVGMGRQLMSWPVFAETMDECEQALAPFVDWALTQVLDDDEALAQVDVVQPVLWAVMVSLAAVWRSAGVLPAAVVGHSQGEIAAACVAGVLSLPDAAKVVALRSQAIKALTGLGGMASVALPVEQVEYHLREWASRVSVAAVNGPASTVIAGDTEALAEVVNVLQARDVQVKHIAVDYASHSPLVERIRDELLQALATVAPSAGTATMISTVTGEPVDGAELDAGYWYRNLRETVVFEGATRWLLKHGHDLFIEVSPHPVLQLALTETIDDTHAPATVLSTLRRDDDTPARLTRSVAAAFTAGAPVDWSAFKTAVGIDGQASRIGLPTYAFQRQRFWPAPMPVPAEVVELNAEFWAAVDSEDISAIASMLGAHGADDESSLAAAVPLLSDWRRRRGDESIVDKWRYTVGWKPLPVNSAASLTGTWLAFRPAGQEDAGSVDSIINGLNVRVVSVELNSADLTVDRLGDRLAELVAREGKEFEGVLLFTPAFDESVREGVERPASLLSVVTALQALDSAGILAPLWCFTRNAVSVGHDDSQIDICQAGVWGLGRTAALELPHRWGGLMDLPADVDSDTASSVVSVLSHAIGEDQVAIRSSGLFGRRLKHADGRDGSWEPADADVSGGTVLVTGGTGGLGAHVARWLARQGAAHLLLTSRRGDQAPGAVALREELSDLGAAVTIVACDVADIDSLAVVLGEIPAEHPLVGAIHTAGIVEEVSIGDLDEEALARVLSGKVVGAENLDRLLDSHPLKFFVSFSSMAGVWGGGGQAAYSAANAMLDAVAHRRRARGLVATSVAWGHWAGEGLAAEGDRAGILSGRGLVAMQPDLAVMALGQALKYGDRFMAVADIDWDRFIPLFTSSRLSPLLSDLSEALEIGDGSEPGEGTGTSSVIRTRLVATPVSEQRAVMRDWVRAQVAILLGYSDPQGVPADRAFKELGFDSLTAVELRNRLQVLTGLKLPTTLLFDFPNSAVLADHLLRLLMGIEADRNDVDADPDDARIRNTLMTIPLSRLREAGLVKMLLNLSVQPDESRATEQAEPSAETGVDELLRRAFDMQIRVDGRNGE